MLNARMFTVANHRIHLYIHKHTYEGSQLRGDALHCIGSLKPGKFDASVFAILVINNQIMVVAAFISFDRHLNGPNRYDAM